MTWNLEEELISTTSSKDLKSALSCLGAKGNVKVVKNWFRSDSETYGLVFDINSSDNSCKYFLKACCPSSPSIPIEELLNKWNSRREILSSLGVKTPKLFASKSGLIIEEYIPFNLSADVISNINIDSIRKDIETIRLSLISAEFSPINPFSGLMSRGNDVVWVDFGVIFRVV